MVAPPAGCKADHMGGPSGWRTELATTLQDRSAQSPESAPFSYSFFTSGLNSSTTLLTGSFPYRVPLGIYSVGSSQAIYAGGRYRADQYSCISLGKIGVDQTPSPTVRMQGAGTGFAALFDNDKIQLVSDGRLITTIPYTPVLSSPRVLHEYCLTASGSSATLYDAGTAIWTGRISQTAGQIGLTAMTGGTDSTTFTWRGGSGAPYASATAVPIASPAPGSYGSVQTVSLTDADPSSTIYYTVDGTTPTASGSSEYWGPLTVNATETIKAVAISKDGKVSSAVLTATYTLPTESVTTIQTLGVITASQVANGLGFYVNSGSPWQFALARRAGAKYVRMQASWTDVEQQSPAPMNSPAVPQYAEPPYFSSALHSARNNDLQMTVVAGFGPPYHNLLSLVLPHGAHKGDASLEMQLVGGPGNLRELHFPYDYICLPHLQGDGRPGNSCALQFTGHHSYEGALITSSRVGDDGHVTLGLAAALTIALPPSGQKFQGCAMRSGSRALSCTSGGFSAVKDEVLSLQVAVPGAAGGRELSSGVATYISDTELLLNGTANSTVSDETVSGVITYGVQEVLYPAPASDLPSEPSNVAYANYVSWLAEDMHAEGVRGDIELWNEPPWAGDPWDYRPYLYDYSFSGVYDRAKTYESGSVVMEGNDYYALIGTTATSGKDPAETPSRWKLLGRSLPPNVFVPGPLPLFGADFGFAANIMHRSFPAGITSTWNGTSGSGSSSLLLGKMEKYSGERLVEPSPTITAESIHPYGGYYDVPEDNMWDGACLELAAKENKRPQCTLPGMSGGPNAYLEQFASYKRKLVNPRYGLRLEITEINEPLPDKPHVNSLYRQTAKGVVRAFLGWQAIGVTPVEFFALCGDFKEPTLGFTRSRSCNSTNTEPPADLVRMPTFNAISGLMADISPISNPPLEAFPSESLPTVISYSGQYPLGVVHMVGSRQGATGNSDVMAIYQMSSCLTTFICWYSLPDARPSLVTISVPPGKTVTLIRDTVNRAEVKYTKIGQRYTFSVSDTPLEIVTDPTR